LYIIITIAGIYSAENHYPGANLLTNWSDIHSRHYNKRVSLDLIRFSHGGISRADLARSLAITRSAVTTIVNEFIEVGIVRESVDGPTTGGRRPILLELDPQRGKFVGIDLGATHVGFLVTDFACGVLHEVEKPFDISISPESGLKQIDGYLRAMLTELSLDLSDLLVIGVGIPGPVVSEQGLVISPPLMPGWENYPIRAQLEEMWKLPVSLNNDAELGALGEWAYGAGRGERHLAYIKVGSGIGAGLLIDGKIFRGATGSAGEIGHTTIRDDGPLCNCGNHGCLETLAGGKAIAKRAIEAVQSGRRTMMASIEPVDHITARDVADAAHRGDLVAQQIMKDAGTYLGIAIASLVNLFNPNMVVVGGGIAQMGDLLLQPIRQVVQQRSLRSSAQAVRINTSVLGRRSSSMGAAVQALNTFLDHWTQE
jgi:glucokinase-like ROK family protein